VNKIKFVGRTDQYLDGVPNHDMTAEEWEALSPAQQKLALDSGLYQFEKETKKSAQKAEE